MRWESIRVLAWFSSPICALLLLLVVVATSSSCCAAAAAGDSLLLAAGRPAPTSHHRRLTPLAGEATATTTHHRSDAGGVGWFPSRPLQHLGKLVVLGARSAWLSGDGRSMSSREGGAAEAGAAVETPAVGPAASATAPTAKDDGALHRRKTMSAGGVRELNEMVSFDELLVEEEEAAAGLALRGGGGGENEQAKAAELRRMQTTMERNHMYSSFLAGIGSGVMASVFCAPLDLVRTRMQVMGEVKRVSSGAAVSRLPNLSVYKAITDIIKEDGFRGCFRGLGATLATVPLFWGIYFPLYEECKRELHGRYNRFYGVDQHAHHGAGGAISVSGQCPPVVHMGSAILAGAVADCVCNPMFLVRTRMQTEALHYFEQPLADRRPHGLVRTVRNLYAEGGPLVFWRGLTASLLGLSHVAIQFPAYEYLKAEARAKSPTGEESAADLLLASGVAKMCASLVTYPHEVVRSRMMDARGPDAGKNVFAMARRIVGNEGYGSLYTGIHVSLLRVVPNCCITFMSYELILRWAKEHAAR